jgi:hypothetical protein
VLFEIVSLASLLKSTRQGGGLKSERVGASKAYRNDRSFEKVSSDTKTKKTVLLK